MQEFCDPLAYISRIRSAAEPYGIAKVVPPAGAAGGALTALARASWLTSNGCTGWHQAFADPLASCAEDFETKQQRINHLQEGQPFGEVRTLSRACARLDPKAAARRAHATRCLRIERWRRRSKRRHAQPRARVRATPAEAAD